MRDTQLILIDGLPGSGKSTTAEWVARRLQEEDLNSVLYSEREAEHPLNVGGELHPSGDTTGEAMFARYTVKAFIEESLNRWTSFVASARQQPSIHILDSYPFQSSARILLQMDANRERLLEYISSVDEIMEPLRPILIFLEATDPEAAFRSTCEARGPAWTEYAVSVVTQCRYATARGLSGFGGALVLMREYHSLLEELLARFPYPLLRLKSCHGRWDDCHAKVSRFLQ